MTLRSLTHPEYIVSGTSGEGRGVKRVFRAIVPTGQTDQAYTVVDWLLLHPGLSGRASKTFLYKHGAGDAARMCEHPNPRIPAATEDALRESLDGAGMAVVLEAPPPPRGYECPLTRSVKNLQAAWITVLDQELLVQGMYALEDAGGRVPS
jgi:hypothetical protein